MVVAPIALFCSFWTHTEAFWEYDVTSSSVERMCRAAGRTSSKPSTEAKNDAKKRPKPKPDAVRHESKARKPARGLPPNPDSGSEVRIRIPAALAAGKMPWHRIPDSKDNETVSNFILKFKSRQQTL